MVMTGPRRSSPFYTRGPGLAFVRDLVEAAAQLDFDRKDFARVFKAVDIQCSELFPSEHREQWFSPVFLGGAEVGHTPPHIIFGVYAIYSDLSDHCPEPVSFRSSPLNLAGAMAVQLEPGAGFLVESCLREAAPMTDLLLRIPARLTEHWIADIYGTPKFRPGVITAGWNMAAESLPTAICGGYLLLHEATRRVLNPIAAEFTAEEQELFFEEPPIASRLERYRERIAQQMGVPLDVLQRNHEQAQRVLEAYLA